MAAPGPPIAASPIPRPDVVEIDHRLASVPDPHHRGTFADAPVAALAPPSHAAYLKATWLGAGRRPAEFGALAADDGDTE